MKHDRCLQLRKAVLEHFSSVVFGFGDRSGCVTACGMTFYKLFNQEIFNQGF